MKVKALVLALLVIGLVGCGGSTSNPVPVTTSTHDVTTASIPATDLINMVGKTMHYTSDNGCHTDIAVSLPPQDIVAGRGGVNVVYTYAKDRPDCYWNVGITGAALQFVMHRYDDNIYRPTAMLMQFPEGCPFPLCANRPKPVDVTVDVIDNDSSIPPGYDITPPALSGSEHLVFDTFSTGFGEYDLTFDNIIPAGSPLGTSTGEFWRTEFYIQWLDQPGFSGWTAVSEQWEAHCGHEKWFFSGNVPVRVESPNDGIKHDCTPMDKKYTMVLTSVN